MVATIGDMKLDAYSATLYIDYKLDAPTIIYS